MKDWWQREKWMDKVGAQRENLDKQEQQDLKRLNKIATPSNTSDGSRQADFIASAQVLFLE